MTSKSPARASLFIPVKQAGPLRWLELNTVLQLGFYLPNSLPDSFSFSSSHLLSPSLLFSTTFFVYIPPNHSLQILYV